MHDISKWQTHSLNFRELACLTKRRVDSDCPVTMPRYYAPVQCPILCVAPQVSGARAAPTAACICFPCCALQPQQEPWVKAGPLRQHPVEGSPSHRSGRSSRDGPCLETQSTTWMLLVKRLSTRCYLLTGNTTFMMLLLALLAAVDVSLCSLLSAPQVAALRVSCP